MSDLQFSADVLLNQQGIDRQLSAINGKVQRAFQVNPRSFALGRITSDVNQFSRSLEAASARVSTFGASAVVYFSITRGIREMVNETINLEKKLGDINVILNANSSQIRKFGSDLFEIAKNTRQSFDTVADAALEFSRQGLGMQETLKRTRDSLILAGQAGLDIKTSVESLTATLNTFNNEALDSTQIINKIIAVDTAFAVSANDLAQAIGRVGNTAQEVKVPFNDLLGVIAALQQRTGRGGEVISNALRTIFVRIQRTDTLDRLQDLGVAVRDLQGNILPALDILRDLAGRYGSLSDGQRAYVAELVAGNRQVNILQGLLKDLASSYSIVDDATRKASDATDEAIRRNELLNRTLSANVNKTTQTIKQALAGIGELTAKPLLENVLGIFNAGGNLINSATSGEGLGARIGQGILKGIGSALAGPGLALGGAVLMKLFGQVGGYGAKAFGQLITQPFSNKELNLQASIAGELERQKLNGNDLLKQNLTREQLENKLLNIIRLQTLEMERQKMIERGLAVSYAKAGLRAVGETGAFKIDKLKTAAGGLLPAMEQERLAVSRGVGGATSSAQPVVKYINMAGGRTPVVVNTQEKIIRDFMGSGKDAVFNRNMISAAGGNLGRFGRVENVAKGSIPNFAKPFGYIGIIDSYGSLQAKGLDKQKYWSTVHDQVWPGEMGQHWRFYNGRVSWNRQPTQDEKFSVESYLSKQGRMVVEHGGLAANVYAGGLIPNFAKTILRPNSLINDLWMNAILSQQTGKNSIGLVNRTLASNADLPIYINKKSPLNRLNQFMDLDFPLEDPRELTQKIGAPHLVDKILTPMLRQFAGESFRIAEFVNQNRSEYMLSSQPIFRRAIDADKLINPNIPELRNAIYNQESPWMMDRNTQYHKALSAVFQSLDLPVFRTRGIEQEYLNNSQTAKVMMEYLSVRKIRNKNSFASGLVPNFMSRSVKYLNDAMTPEGSGHSRLLGSDTAASALRFFLMMEHPELIDELQQRGHKAFKNVPVKSLKKAEEMGLIRKFSGLTTRAGGLIPNFANEGGSSGLLHRIMMASDVDILGEGAEGHVFLSPSINQRLQQKVVGKIFYPRNPISGISAKEGVGSQFIMSKYLESLGIGVPRLFGSALGSVRRGGLVSSYVPGNTLMQIIEDNFGVSGSSPSGEKLSAHVYGKVITDILDKHIQKKTGVSNLDTHWNNFIANESGEGVIKKLLRTMSKFDIDDMSDNPPSNIRKPLEKLLDQKDLHLIDTGLGGRLSANIKDRKGFTKLRKELGLENLVYRHLSSGLVPNFAWSDPWTMSLLGGTISLRKRMMQEGGAGSMKGQHVWELKDPSGTREWRSNEETDARIHKEVLSLLKNSIYKIVGEEFNTHQYWPFPDNRPDIEKRVKELQNQLKAELNPQPDKIRTRKLVQAEFPYANPSYESSLPRGFIRALESTKSRKLSKEFSSMLASGLGKTYASHIKEMSNVTVSPEEAVKIARFRLANPDKGLEHWLAYTRSTDDLRTLREGVPHRPYQSRWSIRNEGREEVSAQTAFWEKVEKIKNKSPGSPDWKKRRYWDKEDSDFIGKQRITSRDLPTTRVVKGWGHSYDKIDPQAYTAQTGEIIASAVRRATALSDESPKKFAWMVKSIGEAREKAFSALVKIDKKNSFRSSEKRYRDLERESDMGVYRYVPEGLFHYGENTTRYLIRKGLYKPDFSKILKHQEKIIKGIRDKFGFDADSRKLFGENSPPEYMSPLPQKERERLMKRKRENAGVQSLDFQLSFFKKIEKVFGSANPSEIIAARKRIEGRLKSKYSEADIENPSNRLRNIQAKELLSPRILLDLFKERGGWDIPKTYVDALEKLKMFLPHGGGKREYINKRLDTIEMIRKGRSFMRDVSPSVGSEFAIRAAQKGHLTPFIFERLKQIEVNSAENLHISDKAKRVSEELGMKLLERNPIFFSRIDSESPFLFRGQGPKELADVVIHGESTTIGTDNADKKQGSFTASSFPKTLGFASNVSGGLVAVMKKAALMARPYVSAITGKTVLYKPQQGEQEEMEHIGYPGEPLNSIKVGRVKKSDIIGVIDVTSGKFIPANELEQRYKHYAESGRHDRVVKLLNKSDEEILRHGIYEDVAKGYIPTFAALQKQNLPANIGLDELEQFYQQYAKTMYNPAKGKIPIGLNLFANKIFKSAYYNRGQDYVFGQHDGRIFVPTHFAPTTKRGGYELIKGLSEFSNILMAVTPDLTEMLQKTGFSKIKSDVPISFRGDTIDKDLLVSSLLKTPFKAAPLLLSLSTGQKEKYSNNFNRLDGVERSDIYYGYRGKTVNIRNYLQKMGIQTTGANGIVPNFSALNDAISREVGALQSIGFSSAQARSSIRVSSSPSLASGMNPQGLGVYNTLQETSLAHGMMFARRRGEDVRKSGIPNFADSFGGISIAYLLSKEKQLRNDPQNVARIAAKLRSGGLSTLTGAPSFDALVKAIRDYDSSIGRSYGFGVTGTASLPPTPSQYTSPKPTPFILPPVNPQSVFPQALKPSTYSPQNLRYNFPPEVPPSPRPFVKTESAYEQQVRLLGKQAADALKLNRETQLRESILTRINNKMLEGLKLTKNQERYYLANQEVLRNQQQQLLRINTLQEKSVRIFGGKSAIKELQSIGTPEALEAAQVGKRARSENIRSKLFGLSFVAPLITEGLVRPFIKDNARGRAIGGVASAVGTGTIIGTQIGGAPGAAVGATVGGVLALKSIIDNLTPSFEDLAKKAQELSSNTQAQIDAGQQYIQAQGQLNDLAASGASPLKMRIASQAVNSSFGRISDSGLRRELLGKNIDKQTEALTKYQDRENKKVRGAELDALAAKVDTDLSGPIISNRNLNKLTEFIGDTGSGYGNVAKLAGAGGIAGLQFGGPIGALIGAGLGAGAGVVGKIPQYLKDIRVDKNMFESEEGKKLLEQTVNQWFDAGGSFANVSELLAKLGQEGGKSADAVVRLVYEKQKEKNITDKLAEAERKRTATAGDLLKSIRDFGSAATFNTQRKFTLGRYAREQELTKAEGYLNIYQDAMNPFAKIGLQGQINQGKIENDAKNQVEGTLVDFQKQFIGVTGSDVSFAGVGKDILNIIKNGDLTSANVLDTLDKFLPKVNGNKEELEKLKTELGQKLVTINDELKNQTEVNKIQVELAKAQLTRQNQLGFMGGINGFLNPDENQKRFDAINGFNSLLAQRRLELTPQNQIDRRREFDLKNGRGFKNQSESDIAFNKQENERNAALGRARVLAARAEFELFPTTQNKKALEDSLTGEIQSGQKLSFNQGIQGGFEPLRNSFFAKYNPYQFSLLEDKFNKAKDTLDFRGLRKEIEDIIRVNGPQTKQEFGGFLELLNKFESQAKEIKEGASARTQAQDVLKTMDVPKETLKALQELTRLMTEGITVKKDGDLSKLAQTVEGKIAATLSNSDGTLTEIAALLNENDKAKKAADATKARIDEENRLKQQKEDKDKKAISDAKNAADEVAKGTQSKAEEYGKKTGKLRTKEEAAEYSRLKYGAVQSKQFSEYLKNNPLATKDEILQKAKDIVSVGGVHGGFGLEELLKEYKLQDLRTEVELPTGKGSLVEKEKIAQQELRDAEEKTKQVKQTNAGRRMGDVNLKAPQKNVTPTANEILSNSMYGGMSINNGEMGTIRPFSTGDKMKEIIVQLAQKYGTEPSENKGTELERIIGNNEEYRQLAYDTAVKALEKRKKSGGLSAKEGEYGSTEIESRFGNPLNTVGGIYKTSLRVGEINTGGNAYADSNIIAPEAAVQWLAWTKEDRNNAESAFRETGETYTNREKEIIAKFDKLIEVMTEQVNKNVESQVDKVVSPDEQDKVLLEKRNNIVLEIKKAESDGVITPEEYEAIKAKLEQLASEVKAVKDKTGTVTPPTATK